MNSNHKCIVKLEETTPIRIKLIDPYDWTKILRDSQSEGYNMVNRLLIDFRSGTNRFDASGEALFACLTGNGVAAVAGLNREPDEIFKRASRLRRLYVVPELRGHGLGRSLVAHITALAQSDFDLLTVNAGKLDASGFYERLGFTAIDHPKITHIKGLTHNNGVHSISGSRASASSRNE